MHHDESFQSTLELERGSYGLSIEEGESPLRLVRGDGSVVELVAGRSAVIHLARPETLTLHFRANGRTPRISVERLG